MRIGVYGGTFNPIHRGHLTAARAAADALGLEKVLLIPDNLPPHKELPAGSATGEDRLAMCRLTAGEVPGMEVLDLELRRNGPSYTRSIRTTSCGCSWGRICSCRCRSGTSRREF